MKKIMMMTAAGLFAVSLLAGCGNVVDIASPDDRDDGEEMGEVSEVGELISFDYHPGYGDMEGGYHNESLKRNEAGDWVIETCDQDTFNSPTVTTVYAVSDEAVKGFVAFIRDKRVLKLVDRKESDLFVTDYHPWSYSLSFDETSIGGKNLEMYSIGQYREYSDRDRELLKELDGRFDELRGEMISQTVEEDEE